MIVNKAAFYLVLNKAVNLNLGWAGKPSLWLMEAGPPEPEALRGAVASYGFFVM